MQNSATELKTSFRKFTGRISKRHEEGFIFITISVNVDVEIGLNEQRETAEGISMAVGESGGEMRLHIF